MREDDSGGNRVSNDELMQFRQCDNRNIRIVTRLQHASFEGEGFYFWECGQETQQLNGVCWKLTRLRYCQDGDPHRVYLVRGREGGQGAFQGNRSIEYGSERR